MTIRTPSVGSAGPTEFERRYWLWGLLGWLAITLLCLLTHLGSLQTHLATEATAALAGDGVANSITGLDVDYSGEIATLRGTVPDLATKEQAGAVLAGLSGTRRVENELQVVAPAPAPTTTTTTTAPATTTTTVAAIELRPGSVSAELEPGSVTLTGEVPSRDVADGLVAAAAAQYASVDDQLTVAEDVEASGWMTSAGLFGALDGLDNGRLDIADGGLTLTGTVPADGTKQRIGDSVAAAVPDLDVDNQLVEEADAQGLLDALDLSGITFETASATITADSLPILDEAVAVLAANPAVTVEVQGHTDSDGSAAANQSLSEARAQAVADYLSANGIDAARLTAVGFGEEQPIASNDTPEGKAMNRRIEFEITGGA